MEAQTKKTIQASSGGKTRRCFLSLILLIEKNVGFLKACNVGVKEAKGDIIILVSNDVRIHNDITHYILECMKIYKDKCIHWWETLHRVNWME